MHGILWSFDDDGVSKAQIKIGVHIPFVELRNSSVVTESRQEEVVWGRWSLLRHGLASDFEGKVWHPQ